MTPEQAAALRAPFPASAIGKLPKGGVMLDFVGHAATTDRLLSVDPEWSWEPVAFDERGLPAFDGRNLWIKLTICGVTRYGVGDGGSYKECIGDAIRNAAMRFGVALDLWAREDLSAIQQPGPPQVFFTPTANEEEAQARTLEPLDKDKRSKSRAKGAGNDPRWTDQPTGDTSDLHARSELGKAYRQAGISDPIKALDYAESVIGRRPAGSQDMSVVECEQVTAALRLWAVSDAS